MIIIAIALYIDAKFDIKYFIDINIILVAVLQGVTEKSGICNETINELKLISTASRPTKTTPTRIRPQCCDKLHACKYSL